MERQRREVLTVMLGAMVLRRVLFLCTMVASLAILGLSQQPAPRLSVTLTAQPSAIERGQSATLKWFSQNAASASLNQGIGTVQVNGSREVFPTQSTTYEIIVKGPGGTARSTATVTVRVPRRPRP